MLLHLDFCYLSFIKLFIHKIRCLATTTNHYTLYIDKTTSPGSNTSDTRASWRLWPVKVRRKSRRTTRTATRARRRRANRRKPEGEKAGQRVQDVLWISLRRRPWRTLTPPATMSRTCWGGGDFLGPTRRRRRRKGRSSCNVSFVCSISRYFVYHKISVFYNSVLVNKGISTKI